jgi:Asp-tRNA(Asn)/Glu-tRNA(Gln) amidotransferase C subunit
MPESGAGVTAETVRQLAALVGIQVGETQLEELASGLQAMIGAVERCEALNLAEHEPATTFRLSGGATDAEL